MKNSKRIIIVTCSAGGHFEEVKRATSLLHSLEEYELVLVSYYNDRIEADNTFRKKIYLAHPQKKINKTIVNLFQSLFIIFKHRPKIVISTGADVTLFICIFCKMLATKLIFIESGANVYSKTLTGRIVYHFSNYFYVQWVPLQKIYPKSHYGGPLF